MSAEKRILRVTDVQEEIRKIKENPLEYTARYLIGFVYRIEREKLALPFDVRTQLTEVLTNKALYFLHQYEKSKKTIPSYQKTFIHFYINYRKQDPFANHFFSIGGVTLGDILRFPENYNEKEIFSFIENLGNMAARTIEDLRSQGDSAGIFHTSQEYYFTIKKLIFFYDLEKKYSAFRKPLLSISENTVALLCRNYRVFQKINILNQLEQNYNELKNQGEMSLKEKLPPLPPYFTTADFCEIITRNCLRAAFVVFLYRFEREIDEIRRLIERDYRELEETIEEASSLRASFSFSSR